MKLEGAGYIGCWQGTIVWIGDEMAQMLTDSEVLVVGGGLTGPVTALALASAGISSTVIDAMPVTERRASEFDGRAYALSLSTVRMLRALKIWDSVERHSRPISEIRISDGEPGAGSPSFLHFQSSETDEGPMGWILEDRFLRAALLEAMDSDGYVRQLSGLRVMEQAASGGSVTLTLDNGHSLSAQMLIGCDGRNSGVARRAGISRTGWDYRQMSLVCAVEHELPNNGIAHQLFLPQGPLAILPLPGSRSSIVWTEERSRAQAIQGLDDSGYLGELMTRFGSFRGDVSLSGRRYCYPLGLSVATSFISDRLALAGDAAHGIHPLAGQGLNLGLRDVAALAEVLVDAQRRGEDMGSPVTLECYQRWRRFDTAALAVGTDVVNRLFSNNNPFLQSCRDVGMGMIGKMPRLRRGFIHEAAGLSGDLPKLLLGQTL